MCWIEVCRTSILSKGFNWVVQICCLCALIRGLQNLEAPFGKGFNCCGAKLRLRCADSRFAKPWKFPKGRRFYSFCVVQKEPKSTPEVCEPLDSGDDSKLCRKWFCRNFRRHVTKPVLPTKRRRKGFESVRKGYRSADARLIFFENGLLYCKLTVASGIRKGLLHVSFGAVGSCCRSALRKSFSLSVGFIWAEKTAFSANQKIFFCRKLYALSSKAAFFMYQKPFFRTNLSLFTIQSNPFLPSISHSHHP